MLCDPPVRCRPERSTQPTVPAAGAVMVWDTASTEMACALGEMLGLAFGAGNGDVRYLYHSVNAARGLPADFPHFRLTEAASER